MSAHDAFAAGKYDQAIKLFPGVNTLEVTAKDAAGNAATRDDVKEQSARLCSKFTPYPVSPA